MSVTVQQGVVQDRDQAVRLIEHQGLFCRDGAMQPGDFIRIPARTLHAARCPKPARYVVGFESELAAKKFKPEEPSDL